MSSCPECRKTLYPNQKKCTCGWKAQDAKDYKNPRHGLCEYNDHGMLCGKAGAIALHTGEGGPWYCRNHALGLRGMNNKKSKLSIKEYMDSVKEKLPDPEALEERIAIQMEGNHE